MDVDEETHEDIQAIICESDGEVRQKYSEGSFQQVFWDQQLSAANIPGKGRRWHPLMIKWCIFCITSQVLLMKLFVRVVFFIFLLSVHYVITAIV